MALYKINVLVEEFTILIWFGALEAAARPSPQNSICTMKVKKFDLLLIVLCLVLACGIYNKGALERFVYSSQNIGLNAAPNVWISKIGQLHYKGPINYKGYELLQKLYANSKKKITNSALIIESGGGDAFAGLLIGKFIKKKNFSIKIPNFCFSACANYIFPAGHFKYLGKNALIGFHESVLRGTQYTTKEVTSKMKVTPDQLKLDMNDFKVDTRHLPTECKLAPNSANSQAQEEKRFQEMIVNCLSYFDKQTTSFYKKLNIDSRFSEIGVSQLREAQKSNKDIQLFYYDADSLKALGVSDIIYPYDWTPKDNPAYKKMVEVKLSDWQ